MGTPQWLPDVPPAMSLFWSEKRVTDLDAAIRQLRQIGCLLYSCTISASYEVTQAQKAMLQLDHTARGASTSSEELNAQTSPRTDDEYNLLLGRPFGAKPVLRRFSGPRIGSVRASSFVDDFVSCWGKRGAYRLLLEPT